MDKHGTPLETLAQRWVQRRPRFAVQIAEYCLADCESLLDPKRHSDVGLDLKELGVQRVYADMLSQAEKYVRMAEQFGANPTAIREVRGRIDHYRQRQPAPL